MWSSLILASLISLLSNLIKLSCLAIIYMRDVDSVSIYTYQHGKQEFRTKPQRRQMPFCPHEILFKMPLISTQRHIRSVALELPL